MQTIDVPIASVGIIILSGFGVLGREVVLFALVLEPDRELLKAQKHIYYYKHFYMFLNKEK